MKIDYNIFDGKMVSIVTINKTEEGKLHLHKMDYPKRIIFEINNKYYEEFQIRGIKEIKME